MKYITISLFFLVPFLFVLPVHAQTIKHNIQFNHLTTKDGLVSDEVRSVFQDSKGYIWVTSFGGVCRYDGSECRVFPIDVKDSTAFHTALVNGAVEDKNGDIWFATLNKGLAKYDCVTEKITHFNKESVEGYQLKGNRINSVYADHNKDIWFGMNRFGFGKVTITKDTREFRVEYFMNKDIGQHAQLLFEDSKNTMWVAGVKGLVTFDNNGSVAKYKSIITGQNVNSIAEDNNGDVFFVMANGNFYWAPRWKRNKEQNWLFMKKDSALTVGVPTKSFQFCFDKNNRLLAATRTGGFFIANPNTHTNTLELIEHCENDVSDDRSIASNSLLNIFTDKMGVVWISTANAGVCYFDLNKKQFKHIKKGNAVGDLKENLVYAMAEDSNRNLWVSIVGSPIHYLPRDSDKFQYLEGKSLNSNNKNFISEVVYKNKHSMWMGSWGVHVINDHLIVPSSDFEFIHNQPNTKKKNKLASGTYFCLLQDRLHPNTVWLGNYAKGLTRVILDENLAIVGTDVLMHIEGDSTSLPSNTIRSIIQDSKGQIWVAGSNGICRLLRGKNETDLPTFKRFVHNPNDDASIPYHSFLCLYEDKSGVLWAGSLGGGLIRVNRSSTGIVEGFKTYTTDNGLPENTIKGILEDEHGNLWISTSGGLAKFNPIHETFANYTEEDGLQGNIFRDNAFVKRQNGQMVFGGLKGLTMFHPDSIKQNPHKALPIITDFKVSGKSIIPLSKVNGHVLFTKSISDCDTVEITHLEKTIEFVFSAIHYSIPKKNGLMYRLDKFDQDWIQVDYGRRFASYTNLPAGTYTFEVKASNCDGVWNDNATEITLIVHPPWWETVLFRVFMLVLFLGSGLAYYLYRMRLVKAENDRLEKLVAVRTENLQEANTNLATQQKELIKSNEEVLFKNIELGERQEEILAQNEEIIHKSEELKSINDELETQKSTLLKANNNMKLMGQFGQHITAVLDTDAINQVVNEYLDHFMDSTAKGFGLLSSKKQQIVFSDFVDKNRESDKFFCSLKNSDNLVALCVNERRTICSEDLVEEFGSYISASVEITPDHTPHSAIYYPLLIDDNVIGIIVIHHFEAGKYETQDLNIVTNLASYLSIAITNAQSYEIIQQKNNHIKSSIKYAQTIQATILPPESLVSKYFDSFTLFKPKDIVSGDFYWFAEVSRPDQPPVVIFSVIDCTGHGVPGAIMSMVGNGALNRIVKTRGIHQPSEILELLDEEIRKALNQDQSDNHDGMDVCMCSFEQLGNGKTEVKFAASKRPLYVFKHNEGALETIKGTRRYIGGILSKSPESFIDVTLELTANDVVYLSTDGYADQNNGDRKRFGTQNLEKLLEQIATKPTEVQLKVLENELSAHQEGEDQRDDITIVGLRLV